MSANLRESGGRYSIRVGAKIKKAARHAVLSNVKIIDKHRSDAQLQSKQLLC
ncbi:hypothetical protein MKY59_05645 [Paenibacillus sp. FSL W8-0426]|uniref:hypothetical protein n=1 Tax=Paenibacillus sp. FSL W8-0426 TaxID=2921714 RepID=UPI0030DC82C5